MTRRATRTQSPDAREVVDAAQSEADFQRQVVELAVSLGWTVRHNADSRRTQAGEPDLELLRGATMLRLELKGEKGVVRPAQQFYIDRLKLVKFVHAEIVRPRDFEALKDTLERAVR